MQHFEEDFFRCGRVTMNEELTMIGLIASKLQFNIPEGITLFKCQCNNVFWPSIAIIIAVF